MRRPLASGLALSMLLGLGIAGGAGCSSPKPKDDDVPTRRVTPVLPSLCTLNTVQSGRRSQDFGVELAPLWFSLLLPGYRQSTGQIASPVVNCLSGRVTAIGGECVTPIEEPAPLPRDPLTDRDLILVPMEGRYRLAWVITDRFASGEAVGPIAVVDVMSDKLVVRALGTLRAYHRRARLRFETVGGRKLLVAEGEFCPTGDPKSCARGVRIMPLIGERFVSEPLLDADGNCVGPAFLELTREETVRHGDIRRLVLEGNVTFTPNSVVVHEQVSVYEAGTHGSAPNGSLLRRAESDRTITFRGTKMVATNASLWTRMLAAP
jgi:hypothetical protein